MIVLGAPALPLHSAGKYVAGAYLVFVALMLVYVAIMARRLTNAERELSELRREAAARASERDRSSEAEPQREPVG